MYLTDVPRIAREAGGRVDAALMEDYMELEGANDRAALAELGAPQPGRVVGSGHQRGVLVGVIVALGPRGAQRGGHGVPAQRAREAAGPPDDAGWVRTRIPLETQRHAETALLRLGPELEVLGPPQLRARMAEQTSWASCGVATSPVPMAHTGS